MAASQPANFNLQEFTDVGQLLVGGRLYTYAYGTTAQKIAYTDPDGTVPHTYTADGTGGQYIALNTRGELPAPLYLIDGSYDISLKRADGSTVWTRKADGVDNVSNSLKSAIAASSGSLLMGFIQAGALAIKRWVQDKLREIPSVGDWGAVGGGATYDTSAIGKAIAALPQRGLLTFQPAPGGFKIDNTLEFFGKAGAVIDCGNQQVNGTAIAAGTAAIHLKGISQAIVKAIYVVGAMNGTGVLLDADANNITIHALFDKIYAASFDVGIQIGTATIYQVSDSQMQDLYASDCNLGIVFSGENTLAMVYGRVAAYNNNTLGVHFERGGGLIQSLQVANSNNDLFFGQTDGANHNLLASWVILGGYSEESAAERFIDSAACSDGNPFRERITLSGIRVTPFSSTNVVDFIQWRLNGDLHLLNMTINHGQQLPRILVDANTAHRQPHIVVEGTLDCNPKTAPQVMMSYKLTDPRQRVTLTLEVDNGLSWWNNGGATDAGTVARGVFMRKIEEFDQTLLSVAGLLGAWNLRDLSSGVCRNLVLGGEQLGISAEMEERDFWQDDGLIGFFSNATTSKTVSTGAGFPAAEYTFGMILRAPSAGIDETDYTSLGGTTGMRLGIGNVGGAFVRVQVAGYNCQAAPTHPHDAHGVIGRYVPGVWMAIDAINLRTGEKVSATINVAPALADLAWSNGLSFRNDGCVRGHPFVCGRAITNNEVSSLLQSMLLLTDSWRYA